MKDYVNSAALQEYTTKLVAKLKTLFPGTPTAAATVADMTDHSKTYVYVGSETGYTAGDWYYWNGTAWTSGGPFQATSIITDTTLAVAGEAADAKATGDAIAAAKTAVLNAMAPAYSTSGTYAVGRYVNHDGKIYRCTTAITTAEAWTAGHWTEVPLGTDLADQVGALKESLSYLDYGAVSIQIVQGTAHSSEIDNIIYEVKSGKEYYIAFNSDNYTGNMVFRAMGRNSDTSEQIAQITLAPGGIYKFTAANNYASIGFYWNTNWMGGSGDAEFMIYSDDSIFHKNDVATQTASEALLKIDATSDMIPINWEYSHYASDWERGTLDDQGNDSDSGTRLRNKGYYSIPDVAYIINIECISTVQCSLNFFSDSAFISSVMWTGSMKATVPNNATRIRILVRYTSNASIFTSAIANNLFTLAYTTKLVDEVLNIGNIPDYDYDTNDIGIQSTDISAVKIAFAEIVSQSGTPSESFFFITDPHPYYLSDSAQVKKFYATIAKSFYQIPAGFLVSGGDWLTDGMTKAEACEALGYITGVMEHITSGKYYPLLGNHDMNIFGDGDSPTLSYGAIINAMFPVQGSAYYHFNGRSTSFYAIDTGSDHSHVIDEYRLTQLEWLATALTEDNSPHIAILEHIYCATSPTTPGAITNVYDVAGEVNKIIAAYNGRTTITVNNKNFDYTNSTGRIEFILAGHVHSELSGYKNGVAVVVCAMSLNSSIIGFDAILVDYENRNIKLLRSNTGAVRTIPLDETP